MEKVHLNGETIIFKVDTGAGVTSTPQSDYKPKRQQTGPLKRLFGPGRNQLKVKAEGFRGKKVAKGPTPYQRVYVVAGLIQQLLISNRVHGINTQR